MGMVEVGTFIHMGALMLMAIGGFWSTMDMETEEKGMLGRLRGSAEMPYPGGLVREGESRE